jgi:hypothetical protein
VKNRARHRLLYDINLIYIRATALLAERLDHVGSIYSEKRETFIIKILSWIADRRESYASKTRERTIQAQKKFLNDIKKKARAKTPPFLTDQECFHQWQIAREGGQVFMDEISYLTNRIDIFNTIRLAFYGLLVTIASVLLPLSCSQRSKDDQKYSAVPDATLLTKVESLTSELSQTRKAIEDKGSAVSASAAALSQKLDALGEQVPKIQTAIDSLTKTNGNTKGAVDAALFQLKTLAEQAARIEAAVVKAAPDSPQDMRPVIERLEKLQQTLGRMRLAMEKIPAETAARIPKQKPVKGWGIGVIRSEEN